MTNELDLLPPFQWRGVSYPVTSRSVSFGQRQIEHEIGRRNQDLVESTGAQNMRFSYTLSMRNGLFKGPYSDMFTEGLRKLFTDARNREAGTLRDPVYGTFRAVPVSYGDDTDIQRRDGTDVRIEFMQAPEDDDASDDDPPTAKNVEDDRNNLAVDAVELVESGQVAPDSAAAVAINEIANTSDTRRIRSLNDAFQFVNGIGQQILGAADRADAALERLASNAKQLEETAATLTSAEAWAIQADSRSLRDKANRARENRSQVKPVLTRTVGQTQSVASLAANLGVSVQSLLEANPGLSRSPTVPRSTRIVVPE